MKVKDDIGMVIWVIGATSGIGEAFCRVAIEHGCRLIITGRNPEKLKGVITRLDQLQKGCVVDHFILDIVNIEEHSRAIEKVMLNHPTIDGCFISCGILNKFDTCLEDWGKATEMITCNFTAHISLVNGMLPYFLKKNNGFISCVSSVAGDIGRKEGAIYGATKAGLSNYLQGVRHHVYPRKLLIQTVKPGPVATPMVRRWDLPLIAKVEPVARTIFRGILKGKPVVYVPSFWRLIMAFVPKLPEKILFKIPW